MIANVTPVFKFDIDLFFFVDLTQKYKNEGHDTIILAGAEYGSGSSRDWAAKGPMLQVTLLPLFSSARLLNNLTVSLMTYEMCFT